MEANSRQEISERSLLVARAEQRGTMELKQDVEPSRPVGYYETPGQRTERQDSAVPSNNGRDETVPITHGAEEHRHG